MSKDRHIVTHQPEDELLKKYISYYYFQEASANEEVFRFSFYPHYENALTVYRNSITKIHQGYHVMALPSDEEYYFTYSQLFKYAAFAELFPPFERIGIVFKAAGLNHFLKQDLGPLIEKPINPGFSYLREPFIPHLDRLFSNDSIPEKVLILDTFFRSQFNPNFDQRLEKAIQIMMNAHGKLTVQDLSDEMELSRKTLLRLFKKHLNCSVKDYLDLIRFRNAINLYHESPTKLSLTELSYEATYNDQSEFIHHFKKITDINPKQFFKHVRKITDHKTFWELRQK